MSRRRGRRASIRATTSPVLLAVLLVVAVAPSDRSRPTPRDPADRSGSVARGLPTADPRLVTLADGRPCDRTTDPAAWDAELRRALDRLRVVDPALDPAAYELLDADASAAYERSGRRAEADLVTGTVRLSARVPCWTVASVVVHEHAHLLQARAGATPDRYAANPGAYELQADCAVDAWLPVGAPRWTPQLVGRHVGSGAYRPPTAPCRTLVVVPWPTGRDDPT